MKLAILGLLLIFGTVNAVPAENMDESPEILPESTDEPSVDIKEILDEIIQQMEDNTTIDGEPNVNYLKEVKEYFQQKKFQKSHNRVARQSSGVYPALYHGNTIALQTYERDHWLGCAGLVCARARCPLMYMTGSDWTNCWGEVFKIYRAAGPGEVRVGDLVGIYYPRIAGRWLGCWSNNCGKATCPGHPTTAHGFAAPERWYTCWGEVFKIYARGKSDGSIINSMDDISLYYLQGGAWVSQGTGDTVKTPCLGTVRPPSLNSYDGCVPENFRVWKY